MLPYPTIVVPGITATFLRDFYSLPPEHAWKVMPWTKDYDRIALHPDDLRYEAQEPALMRSDQIYEIAYGSLIEELKEGLIENLDEPVPVFPFGYDWRQPLDDIERRFEAFVQEVIDRTSLLRHYSGKRKKVNLVGHSMGGLIITGYLQRKGKDAPVHKVVTLATPFQGSFEAVVKVVTGTGNISPARSNPRERKAARVTPALYHLLPSFSNGIEICSDDLPRSLFDPEIWPPNIIDSIAEYMRVYSYFSKNEEKEKEKVSRDRAKKLLASMLEQAKRHRKRIETFKLSDANLEPKDWLAVVGVGTETRVHLKIEKEKNQSKFVIHDRDVKNKWKAGNSSHDLRSTGDGTVPYEGAIPPFLKEDNLVLITPDDYGFWEVQDKVLTKAGGFHGILPCMNMLHRLLIRFFKNNAKDKYNNTWGRRAPGSSTWNPPLAINTEKSFT